MEVSTSVNSAAGSFIVFVNATNTAQGSIQATNSTTTAYNTTSDMRLKENRGTATDVSVLRDTVIHDFVWKEHGGIDRGIFAQEAIKVNSRAITYNEKFDSWGADYSKYVPDLIVGWQYHEARIAELVAKVAALEAR